MSKAVRGRNATVYVTGMNASPYLNEYEIESERDDLDVTPLESDDKDFLSGPAENSTTLTGFWNGDEDSLDEILDDLFGVDDAHQMTVFPGGVLSGKRAYMLANATQLKYKTSAKSDDITEAEAEFRSGRYRGVVLKTPAVVNATGVGTSFEHATATDFGAVAMVHVLDITGAPDSVAFGVAHSPDDGTYSPLLSFGTFTEEQVPTAKFVEIDNTVTVDEFVHSTHTFTGGTSPTAKYVVVFHRRLRP